MVDTLKYKDWFDIAKKDLKGAEILYEHKADYGLVLFHLQQAVEKYLKGYLIYKTGVLQEGHSLIKLCKKATSYDTQFRKFIKDSAFLNGYYIETRYPAEDPLIADDEDVCDGLKFTYEIIEFIEKNI
ncbi:MAG: HEPN domain-containing protein [Clostridiaceae bacterium]